MSSTRIAKSTLRHSHFKKLLMVQHADIHKRTDQKLSTRIKAAERQMPLNIYCGRHCRHVSFLEYDSLTTRLLHFSKKIRGNNRQPDIQSFNRTTFSLWDFLHLIQIDIFWLWTHTEEKESRLRLGFLGLISLLRWRGIGCQLCIYICTII